MPGQPRRRFARALTAWMLHELREHGSATMPTLLERIGYDLRDELTPRQVTAINMATRDLIRSEFIALEPWSGRLHYHQPGTAVPWQAACAV